MILNVYWGSIPMVRHVVNHGTAGTEVAHPLQIGHRMMQSRGTSFTAGVPMVFTMGEE